MAVFGWCAQVFGATADDYYNAARNFFKQGQYSQSIPYFKATLTLIPNHWLAYEGLAQAYYFNKQYEDADDACRKGLAINPESKILQNLEEKMGPLMARPPMPIKAVKGKSGRLVLEGPPLEPVFWVKGSFKYDYSLEGDFNSATNGFKIAAPSAGTTTHTSSAGNGGLGFKLEGGYGLDSRNGMTLTLSAMEMDGFHAHAHGAGVTLVEDFDPLVLGLEMDYCHFWPHDDYRFYIKGGVGYYDALIACNQAVGSAVPGLGDFSGTVGNGDFGVNLGGGFEIRMGDDLGLELSAAFRYATVSDLTYSYTDKATGDKKALGLAILPTGFIGVVDSSTVGGQNGSRLLSMDLTGIEVGLSIDYYVFN